MDAHDVPIAQVSVSDRLQDPPVGDGSVGRLGSLWAVGNSLPLAHVLRRVFRLAVREVEDGVLYAGERSRRVDELVGGTGGDLDAGHFVQGGVPISIDGHWQSVAVLFAKGKEFGESAIVSIFVLLVTAF